MQESVKQDKKIKLWKRFCYECGLDPMQPNKANTGLFMAFLAIKREKKGKVTTTLVNAVRNSFKNYHID